LALIALTTPPCASTALKILNFVSLNTSPDSSVPYQSAGPACPRRNGPAPRRRTGAAAAG
jgi:hypothetical protein